jgi:transcriptional regulator with XRE-family HTH domain
MKYQKRILFMNKGPHYALFMQELKKIFKRKKIKYVDVASQLDMSESSVKRLMSGSDASLSKIERLCEVAGIDFLDLVSLCKDTGPSTLLLTEKQDRYFGKNTSCFYFFHLLYEELYTVPQIKKEYKLTNKTINAYLKKLEELELLERHPNDKIKFLVHGHISLPEFTELGSHLFRTSIDNFSKLVNDQVLMKEKLKGESATLLIGEYYLKKETGQGFAKRITQIIEEMDKASSREERIYNHDELTLFTSLINVMPTRLYFEDITNIK